MFQCHVCSQLMHRLASLRTGSGGLPNIHVVTPSFCPHLDSDIAGLVYVIYSKLRGTALGGVCCWFYKPLGGSVSHTCLQFSENIWMSGVTQIFDDPRCIYDMRIECALVTAVYNGMLRYSQTVTLNSFFSPTAVAHALQLPSRTVHERGLPPEHQCTGVSEIPVSSARRLVRRSDVMTQQPPLIDR